jgi:signal transduction histidine kinase
MVDVAISLKTICDQFADTGRQVSYDGPDHVTIRAYARSLNRAVTNLVENAVCYGEGGLVRAWPRRPIRLSSRSRMKGRGFPRAGRRS